jgi:hypothetical protein
MDQSSYCVKIVVKLQSEIYIPNMINTTPHLSV